MKITSTTCPSKTPIRCSYDNSCVTDIGACASLLHLSCCRYPNLYSCFDGHCENTTNRCPHNKNCSEYCWNGECIDSGECPPLPSCPELTKRCWNGSCIDPNESCSPEPLCSEDETMCADGSCVNLNETCVEYNGCHPDLPILCPDGQCKSNYSDCFCPNNYQYLCYGGNCVVHPRECPVPPAMIKPLPVEYTIDLYQNSELTIISQTAEFQICKVRIGNSTVANSSLIIVRATAVADSLVRRVEPFRGWEGDVFDNILSPIVNLSIDGNYTGDFRITFFVPSYIFSPSYDGGLCLAKINESEQWSCLNDFPNIEPQNSGYAVTGVASFPGSFAIISFVEPVPTTETPAFSKKTSYTAGLWVLVISVVIVVVGLFVLTTFIFGYVKMRRNQKRMRNEQQQDPSKSVELSTFSSNIETGTQ